MKTGRLGQLREQYHKRLCHELIRIRKDKKKGDYLNFADGDSRISSKIAWGIGKRICSEITAGRISGQTAGKFFETITKDFIASAFSLLEHLRPGVWQYWIETDIAKFEQYRDLADVVSELKSNEKLAAVFGRDYIVKPDILISREPVSDREINKKETLLTETDHIARKTPVRKANSGGSWPILHASISCKWTLRSDRAQNIRTEAMNLIRNRKGHLLHIVAVTAEPLVTRIASLALGTGDLDCVYHFALDELIESTEESNDESQLDMLHTLIDGRRLRDISDLIFDLSA